MLALVAIASCDDTPAGRPTAANDQLWKLAPEGAKGGITLSPYAVGMLEDGTITVRELIAKTEELAPLRPQIDELLGPLGGSNIKLADLKLTRDKGAAVFFGDAGKLTAIVLPIADRKEFLARVNGTPSPTEGGIDKIADNACKLFDKHYVCARSEAILASVGKGALALQLAKVGARGDIEIVAKIALGDGFTTIAAAAQIERGTIVVRGLLLTPPAGMLSSLGAPARPRTTIGRTAGFGLLDVRPLLADVPALALAEGVTIVDVAKSLDGPLTLTIPPGELTFEIEQPLNNVAPMQKVLAACDQVPPLRQFGARIVDGTCRIQLPEAHFELDLWIEDQKLRVGKKGLQAGSKSVPLPKAALEMATGQWSFVMWGRGSMFAPTGRPPGPTPTVNPMMLVPIRATSVINEAGVALRKESTKDGEVVRFMLTARTQFANPRALVDQLATITALDAIANTAWQKAKPIAEAHPTSLFAGDYTSGQAGLTLATYLIGAGTQLVMPIITSAPPGGPQAERPPPGMMTQGAVRQYVTAIYPDYLKANPTKPCPSMQELAAFVAEDATTTDEWGKPLLVVCGKDLPPGVTTGIAIISPGPDGQLGTADDIKSF